MTHPLLAGIVGAVLLFWAVGAYNRLVRLRADVNAAFAQLDAPLQQQLLLIESLLATESAALWAALQAAGAQLSATLAQARGRPLDAPRIAALEAARSVLALAWERAEREDAHDLAGPRLPPAVAENRGQLAAQARAGVDHFNAAVNRYNEAVAQFPALLLAWIFGFRPGRAL